MDGRKIQRYRVYGECHCTRFCVTIMRSQPAYSMSESNLLVLSRPPQSIVQVAPQGKAPNPSSKLMPRCPKKSTTQQTFPCPVQGCRTQVRSRWGFTQHVGAKHPGMDLQFSGNEGEFQVVQFPPSDDQTSSPPPSLNAFSQNEPDIHFQVSDHGPSDFDLDGNAEPIPADSTEFHPLINGMYIIYIILQILNK